MKIRIVGAIASQQGITLYMENGADMNLPNDSWKTKQIMDKVVDPLARHETVEIELDDFSVEKVIEDKTAGVIRFIKRTMQQLEGMLAELEGTVVPGLEGAPRAPDPVIQKEELVAVVKTDKGDVEIPGVAQIEKHIEHAATTGNTKGLENFMKRIANVIEDRGHTAQELLNFMKRGDLPIADDGSIVAYKVLNTKGDRFVDCHSGKVHQNLGSVVFMDPKMVDPSRRTECSQGLHIARRGYLHGFGGNVITLVKVAPEDVIAVPQGEPDKMRASGYHIVGVLPVEVHADLRANRPMTGNKAASKLLADVIAGNHVGILEKVQIGAAKGGDVTIKGTGAKKIPIQTGKNGQAKALDDGADTKITPKDIREAAKKAVAAPKAETKAERDARKKREKRAAEKQAKAPKTLVLDPMRKIDGETKSQRDARIKREKYALSKAAK